MNTKSIDSRIADEKAGIKGYSSILRQEKKHLRELKRMKRRAGKRPR